MPIIDADAHVVETEATWNYMDPEELRFRPVIAVDRTAPTSGTQYWVIDGKLKRVPFSINTGSSEETISGFSKTTASTRTLQDVTAPLAHMDELGVDSVSYTHLTLPTILLV